LFGDDEPGQPSPSSSKPRNPLFDEDDDDHLFTSVPKAEVSRTVVDQSCLLIERWWIIQAHTFPDNPEPHFFLLAV
jgi:hypothetical protein